jgi:hypothetical protein
MTSRAGYFLAPIPLLAGVIAAVWLVWSEFGALQDTIVRFVVPGSVELALDEPGTYTIFHEADSVVDGRLYSVQSIGGLQLTVTAAGDGKTVPITDPTISSSYTIGSHSGKSVWGFNITQPGRYRLTAAYPGGQSEPQTVLTIWRGFVGGLVRMILGAVGCALLGFALALALVLTTYFRRRRMLRAVRA